MFGAADGVYMFMLINLLGSEYIVWDKSSSIRFRKPGTGTLYAKFEVTDDDLEAIKSGLKAADSMVRDFNVEFRDSVGNVCSEITKTIYFRKKKRS